MRHVAVRGSAGRVYLAGPLTALDPVGYSALEDALLALGLITEPACAAFPRAARQLRARGFAVSSRWELAGFTAAEEPVDRRAARAADRAALHDAELIAVLDGWFDVPGAVDEAVLRAAVSRRPCVTVGQLLRSARSTAA